MFSRQRQVGAATDWRNRERDRNPGIVPIAINHWCAPSLVASLQEQSRLRNEICGCDRREHNGDLQQTMHANNTTPYVKFFVARNAASHVLLNNASCANLCY